MNVHNHPKAAILRPGVIELLYAQAADTEGNPAGPVLWLVPEIGQAGSLYLDDRATDENVCANLHRSFPGRFDNVKDAIISRGLTPHTVYHDAVNRCLAAEVV